MIQYRYQVPNLTYTSISNLLKLPLARMYTTVFLSKQEEVEEVEQEAALIAPEELIKHPLQNRWAMWFFKNDKARDWCDNLRLVTTFATVEDFWG